MKRYFLLVLVMIFLLIGFSGAANATLIMVSDRGTFESYGSIAENYGFEDISVGSTIYKPGDDWEAHGVTYTCTENVIGWGSYYDSQFTDNGTNMLFNNYWNPVRGTIDAADMYSLFGFDAGWMNKDDQGAVITIHTTVASYFFNVDLNIASNTSFFGFIADDGEYITGFSIYTSVTKSLVAIDNVTLGTTGTNSVPEPSTLILLGSGLVGVMGATRKRLKK